MPEAVAVVAFHFRALPEKVSRFLTTGASPQLGVEKPTRLLPVTWPFAVLTVALYPSNSMDISNLFIHNVFVCYFYSLPSVDWFWNVDS